jgi:hypothetical protein
MSRKIRMVLVLFLIGEACWLSWDWGHKGIISPVGGAYFFHRIELPVPRFHQSDELWRNDLLGHTPGTLGHEGCAVSSAAMVLSYYGIHTDPKRLNEFLTLHDGYTDRGWIYWEKAADYLPDRIQKAYEDLPSYYLIDRNLLLGNPVIVRLRFPQGSTHFVVIVGKQGFDYLIADPGAGYEKGVYPLKELSTKIEALRFYKDISVASELRV